MMSTRMNALRFIRHPANSVRAYSTTGSKTRTALITGAAQGIGRAIALRLADDGLNVALNDIAGNTQKLHEVAGEVREKGRRALTVFADVSRENDVVSMFEQVVNGLGGVDVMIANAGIFYSSSLMEMEVEKWDRIMSVNLRGVMLCYKHAARHMIKQGTGGRIVGAASGLGMRDKNNNWVIPVSGSPVTSAYSASKFAVRGLTQSAALELFGQNITVNAYAPGIINTPMVQDLHEVGTLRGESGMANLKKALGRPELPDCGPDVIASLVSYLVKPEAYFITGQTISADGGIILS